MSEEKSIEDRIRTIIVEQLGVKPEQITPEAKFIEDLGADSLDTVELVMALEEEFGVSAAAPSSSAGLQTGTERSGISGWATVPDHSPSPK